jgi:hypothetical protein
MLVVDIGTQDPGHKRRKPSGIGQLQQQQLKMIAPQAIVVDTQVQPVPVAMEQLPEVTQIGFLRKEGISVVAAIENREAGGLRPGLSSGLAGHGKRPLGGPGQSQPVPQFKVGNGGWQGEPGREGIFCHNLFITEKKSKLSPFSFAHTGLSESAGK